jgi:hypothetical protein
MLNTSIDSFKDHHGMQHAKHLGCWQGVYESCNLIDCMHWITITLLDILYKLDEPLMQHIIIMNWNQVELLNVLEP